MDRDALLPPLVLERRLGPSPTSAAEPEAGALQLALTADERTRLRGLRQSLCGRKLLLQLPRGEALEPGEWLAAGAGDPWVQVLAASEPLVLVQAADPLTLLQAAYHLGNRHVALELKDNELRLLEDPVLEQLLEQRGLKLSRTLAPFLPEAGAYNVTGHHRHAEPADDPGHGHTHQGEHEHAHGSRHEHEPTDHHSQPVTGDRAGQPNPSMRIRG